MTTRVRISDTGCSEVGGSFFGGFKPGTEGSSRKFLISEQPAISSAHTGDDHVPRGRLLVQVKQRFIVEVVTTYQAAGEAEKWLRLLDIQKLVAVPDNGATVIKSPVFLSSVNELDPKRNTTNSVYVSHIAPH